MRLVNRLAASMTLLLVPAVLLAHAGPATLSKAEEALQDYLKGDGQPATIAAFDHLNRTWTVLHWNGNNLTRVQGPTEKPEIALGSKERLRTFIINTNPLVFTADRSATAEAAIDTLATLQQLAAGLANVAVVSTRVRALDQLPPGAPRAPGAPPTLTELVYEYVAALAEIEFNTGPIDEIKTAAADVEKTVAPLKEDSLLAWLQAVESGTAPGDRPSPPAQVTQQMIVEAFTKLAQARDKVAATKLPCAGSIAALAEVAMIKRTPLVGVGAPEREETYETLATEMTSNLQAQGCTPRLATATIALSQWFLANRPTAEGPDVEDRKALADLGDKLWQVLDVAKQRGDALARAKALAETQPAVILAAARLGLFRNRLASQGTLDPALGVLEIPRSSFTGKAIEWTKKRTDTVEVTVDPSLKGKVTLTHPETASGSFTADRKLAEGLEVDFALIRTDLFSSTFEAKDLDGKEGGESRIVETDQATRSGKVAVMAAYRFPLGLGFAVGPQIGVGVDTDDASFFYGVSIRWRFLSLGWGKTRQKVTALRGQNVNDILAEGVALKTKDTFETDDYWSLAISITDLPFFKPKE
jgi:hypothetical protein